MTIFGNDYDTLDGTCERNYISVIDIIQAIKNNIEHGPINSDFECLKTDTVHTNLEVVEKMQSITALDFVFGERRAGDNAKSPGVRGSKYFKPSYNLYDMCLSTFAKIVLF